MPTSSLVILGLEIGGPITYLLSERCARGDSPILPGGGPWGTQYERVAFCAGPELQHLMTTDDVDPSGHVGDQPLPVIYVPAVPRGHNHDDEHVIGENKSVGLIERRSEETVEDHRRQ
jgi:hypothetical protein